jgi:hypothetical protein
MQALSRVRYQVAPVRRKSDPESIVYIQKLQSTYNETYNHDSRCPAQTHHHAHKLTARPSRSSIMRANLPPCIRQPGRMQPAACCPKAKRAPSSSSTQLASHDYHQGHHFSTEETSRPGAGVRPARPHERASRAFSFVGGTGRKAQAPDHSQATSQTADQPARHFARFARQQALLRLTPRKLSRDLEKRQD